MRRDFCARCRFVTLGDLREIYKARPPKRVRPKPEHGHRLWRVATTSSVYFYLAPDRVEAARLSRIYGRDALKGENLVRLATYADIGLVIGTADQKATA